MTSLIVTDTKELTKQRKKRIAEFLKKEGIINDKDTGLILIHMNDGGIAKISKNMDILK